MAGGQHLAGFERAAAGMDGDDGVHRFAAGLRVIFPHADPARTALIEHAVAVAPVSLGGESHGWAQVRAHPVEPLVRIIGKIERSAGNSPGATAILMDPRAHIKRW